MRTPGEKVVAELGAFAGPEGWIQGARRAPSPNADARPVGVSPTLLVVHGISLPAGQFRGDAIEKLFLNRLTPSAPFDDELCALRVSAHLLIRRDGEMIQFVPFVERAWHAGVSIFDGVERCNDFAIGVELEGTDEIPYADVQYVRLASVARAVMARWPMITPSRIVGHSDIAPGRKTDPGPAFRWEEFFRELNRP
ncbi:MAG: 1,6-anhydro-N-acetylmuramyl-L-alanine amidase AmpD [Pseudomonadota bacterium]